MQTHSQVSAALVNKEVDSMEGVVDCGVHDDTKASQLSGVIEKVQADLRKEYDVKEELRRELEFLENGGNPLDFKIGHAASISIQSTCLMDQLAVQYGISEAKEKGSSTLAPSPLGDSVESSGRPGGSSGRESNIADNLLLFDGENIIVDEERKINHTRKRSNITPLEQTSNIDGCRNAKEPEDSVILHIVFESQAYAPTNKSRSSRESAHVTPNDLIPAHSNKSSIFPNLKPNSKDCKELLCGIHTEDHPISSMDETKPARPNDNVAAKASACDEQFDMELDAVQTQHSCSNIIGGGVLEELEDHDIQLYQVVPVKVPNITASHSYNLVGKDEAVSVGFGSDPGYSENIKEVAYVEKANEFNIRDRDATDLHDSQSMKKCVVLTSSAVLNMNNTRIEPSSVYSNSIIDGNANSDQSLVLRMADGSSHGDSREPSAIQRFLSVRDNKYSSRKSHFVAVDTQISSNVEPEIVHPNLSKSSIQIKDQVDLCHNNIDLQNNKRTLNSPQSVKLNGEIKAKPERGQENSFFDNSHSINNTDIVTSTLVVPSCEPANTILFKRGSATTTKLENSAVNHLKLASKAHEDALLKEAWIIEANSRRADELSICAISSEKRKKCHWDFVLEEMAWMANDFLQERVWKITAAAEVCRQIASSGRFKFEEEIMRRKQRNIAKSLAKAVIHFWHSAEDFRSSGKIPIGANNSDLFYSCKANEGDTKKEKGSNYEEAETSSQTPPLPVEGYAIRFLNYITSMSTVPILAEIPASPERINNRGIIEMSWEEELSKESLFYRVAPGAMQVYRESMESSWGHPKRDHLKKRVRCQHFDTKDKTGSYAQHATKKPKLLKHLPEASSGAIARFNGSMPSPVAFQMNNMFSPNTLIKLIANRDRGRKSKGIKMAAGQSGSGSSWSLSEDQALVVLVHDMGTNWELISDAINSTLQFKRIFRKPSECKERHKIVMDTSCDGAESAEDSGSSQPYESTLPGIPKGSALQLFQYLQRPVEEDTLKAHFEKIILIGRKLHTCRNQDENRELKQITPAHNSRGASLSQVCKDNLSGGFLTPLDLCDAIAPSLDVHALEYQGYNASGLSSSQASVTPVLPAINSNTMVQGSPGMVLGNRLSSASSTPLNCATRNVQRYGVPRPSSLPADDQQRMQHCNPIFSGKNIQQCNISAPGTLSVGVERGIAMLPGGNGMGMMCWLNRGRPMPQPGLQGMRTPGMLKMVSTGSMLSGSGVGMLDSGNTHHSTASNPGNSMLGPRDALQMMQNPEDHRQMIMQEIQLQVSQGSGQTVAPFNGISSLIINATIPPPVQMFPVQQNQQSHQMLQQPNMVGNPRHSLMQATNHLSPQHQSYVIRFAEERQLQQGIMPQSKQSFTGSVSPIQNNSQIQHVQPSSSGNSIPMSQVPDRPQQMLGIQNPMMKQRQCQQIQYQQPRAQQQQRRQLQQQAKLMKGSGRMTTLTLQNISTDGSQASGLYTAPKNQVSEKHPLQQGQSFFPGSIALNPTLPQSPSQSKMFSRPLPQSSKKMPPVPSHSDNPNQAVHLPASHTLLGSKQPIAASSLPLTIQQKQHPTNQSQQDMQKITSQKNHQVSPDGRIRPSTEQVEVNQMITTTYITHCADSSALSVSPSAQWKPEPFYDMSMPSATFRMAGSPQENLVGTETLLPFSSQGLVQRQFSGNVSIHKPCLEGQWQQQQHEQQQQQHLQRQAAGQGNLYACPSTTGGV